METPENIATTIRLDKETIGNLDELARSDDRDRSYLIRQAISNYIEMRKWQVEEIKRAINEADSGLFATEEKTTRLLGKWTT